MNDFFYHPVQSQEEGAVLTSAAQPMARGDKLPDRDGGYVYTALKKATRPAADFTPRIISCFPGAAVPLEIPLILWHH